MKILEKKKARELRKKGWSLNEIQKELRVSKSSISIWVRDIVLTDQQRQRLVNKTLSIDAIEKRRQTRLASENAKRNLIINAAKKEVKNISPRELFLIGTALYWAEGGKKQRGIVRFANSDPEMIQLMMIFFKTTCEIPAQKFRGYIHIHQHLDHKKAENYWSTISQIPLNQFYKTYRKPNKSSKNKKDSLPYGTFEIYICDTHLFLKLSGWIQGMSSLS